MLSSIQNQLLGKGNRLGIPQLEPYLTIVSGLSENKSIVRIASCTLSQFVLDYRKNTDRILNSIRVAKQAGCTYRVGPELEITGYSCEDHFYEMDTLEMSWLYLGEIIEKTKTEFTDILCDIGTLVMHNGVRYNCRVYCLNGKIVLIRPKMYLADDGNYREHRWFTGWPKSKIELIQDCLLPKQIQRITGQTYAKFGVAIVECMDGTTIASEICEELFTPESPNVMFGLEGVDILSNGSGSHFQLGKRERRHQLIGEATRKNGGVYMYSNLVGCDGSRLVFDGNSMIYMNGTLIACGEHLTWDDTEVVVATIDLNDVRGYRAAIVSSNDQSVHRDIIVPRIKLCDIFSADSTCANFTLTIKSDSKVPVPMDGNPLASLITNEDFDSLWKINQLDKGSMKRPFDITNADANYATIASTSDIITAIEDSMAESDAYAAAADKALEDATKALSEAEAKNSTPSESSSATPRTRSNAILENATKYAQEANAENESTQTRLKEALENAKSSNTSTIQAVKFVIEEAAEKSINSANKALLVAQSSSNQAAIEAATNRVASATARLAFIKSKDYTFDLLKKTALDKEYRAHVLPMETGDEIGLYSSRWLWDYMIRSGAGGFLLPLSGGVDSTATSMIVYYMCDKIAEMNKPVVGGNDMKTYNKRRLSSHISKLLNAGFLNVKFLWKEEFGKGKEVTNVTTEDLMFLLLHTANMPTKNNSEKTANSAASLAKLLHSYHMLAPIQKGFEGFVPEAPVESRDGAGGQSVNPGIGIKFGYNQYTKSKNELIKAIADEDLTFKWEQTPENAMFSPKYKSDGGDWKENLAIQNVQARLRMLTAYYTSQLLPLYRWNKRYETFITGKNEADLEKIKKDGNDYDNRPKNTSFLLVLGSSNADESLRGFYTKYDAASADINPIGSLSKTHLREFLRWCGEKWPTFRKTMTGILTTVASPELTPADALTGAIQDDEIDIEMTYEQLYILGKLRKEEMMGPVSMFKRLCEMWVGKEVDICAHYPEPGKLWPDGTKPAINQVRKEIATPTIIANIVTIFFNFYGIHRNKMTILTPSVHGTGYSPDDNRYDQRPFLYPGFKGSETHKILVKMAEQMEIGVQPINRLLRGGDSVIKKKYTRRFRKAPNKYTR